MAGLVGHRTRQAKWHRRRARTIRRHHEHHRCGDEHKVQQEHDKDRSDAPKSNKDAACNNEALVPVDVISSVRDVATSLGTTGGAGKDRGWTVSG